MILIPFIFLTIASIYMYLGFKKLKEIKDYKEFIKEKKDFKEYQNLKKEYEKDFS